MVISKFIKSAIRGNEKHDGSLTGETSQLLEASWGDQFSWKELK